MIIYLKFFLLFISFFVQTHQSFAASYISKFTYSCTRIIQNVTVPAGAKYVFVDITGAASGSGGLGTPGYGARVQSTLPVTPGSVIQVIVGCKGSSCPLTPFSSPTFLPGGYNGGGSGYGAGSSNVAGTGGGGASDIRIGGLSLYKRVIVAGGGGGYYCGTSCGSPKGGDAGKFGLSGDRNEICGGTSRYSGGGGNWTNGGRAGFDIGGLPLPTKGILGFGGSGGFGEAGGGGGGYYGGKFVFYSRCWSFTHSFFFFLFFLFFPARFPGGGGTSGAGAGGGSSFSTGLNTLYTTGYQTGDGNVTITFYANPIFKLSATKSIQNLTVPEGYNFMVADMTGAASGSGGIGTPGYGARVQSYLTVTPGSVLHISVGTKGSNCVSSPLNTSTYRPGGYNGGGAGYGIATTLGATGGGGATDIRIGGLSLSDRVVVAGGGGGYYCASFCGSRKGGDAGQFGQPGQEITTPTCSGYGHSTGGGGGWTRGGSAAFFLGLPGPMNGTLGFGGNGGYALGGGGGGGYYGGKDSI
jgi:hypothetical protein